MVTGIALKTQTYISSTELKNLSVDEANLITFRRNQEILGPLIVVDAILGA